MIARRKKKFLELCSLLRDIEADKSNLVAVKQLNVGLILQILADERCVKHYRNHGKKLRLRLKNDRPTKEGAALLRKQMAKCERIVDRYLDQLYIWRSIGDGLAYAYIDTFNMRQVLFNTGHYSVKEDPGFISAKEGLLNETAWLLDAIKSGVPAVLSDITNTVRYGDICLLGGSDPYPIEVKAHPSRRNQRGKRQAARLAELQKYLEEDVALDFRGLPYVRREQAILDGNTCLEQLNLCIQSARPGGYSVCCPEPGLVYAVVCGDFDPTILLDLANAEQSTLFNLNDEKTNKRWIPYRPFVNSIRDVDALFEFVTGNLIILVLVDAAYLCKQLTMPGWSVSMIEDDAMIILYEHESGGVFATSRQFYCRLGFEVMSLQWFVNYQQTSIPKEFSAMENFQTGVIIEVDEKDALDRVLKKALPLFR